VAALALGAGCGEQPAGEVVATPAPTPTPFFTLAYAETDVRGTLRVFAVDERTGALSVKGDVKPSGTPEAPVVGPGPFVVHPEGQLLYYSYESCDRGWCGNLSSYEIEADGALRPVARVGPVEIEAGIEVLSATTRRLIAHWDDAPIHSVIFYGAYSQGELKPDGGIYTGYGHANLPRWLRLTPDEKWGYGVAQDGLVSYRLDDKRNGTKAAARALPAGGRGLEMDRAGRFLYLALATTPPRVEVYAIGEAGLGSIVGTVTCRATIPADMNRPLLLDATGRHLFLSTSEALEIYGVDAASGLLTLKAQEPLSDLDSFSVHPLGMHLYASWRDGTLRSYAIDASTARLTEIGPPVRGRRLQFARTPPPKYSS
jgi:6-phosphogluconolactonase (cycloisomerase 2 family)